LIDQKMKDMDQSIGLYRTQGREPAYARVVAGECRRLMDKLRAEIKRFVTV
jgi:CHASE3 domain sensor protein